MISLILLTLFLSSGPALAWRGYSRGHFGVFVAPPPFWVGPPAVYYRGYYPPPGYYGPGYDGRLLLWSVSSLDPRPLGRSGGLRMGWQRAWTPGYWEYRR